jgi:pyruvate dehydrogenase (quinone)
VPPIPPHVEFDDVKSMTSAIMKGDPKAWQMVKQSLRGKAQEFLNR